MNAMSSARAIAAATNGVPFFNDDQALSAVIVGVDQAVGQCFTQSLMDGGIVHSDAVLHLEGHLDILNQLVIDAEVEVVHIAAPVAGGGADTVGPAGVGIILFLIVQKVGIKLQHDVVFVAEHEKSGRGGVLLPIGADAHGAQL